MKQCPYCAEEIQDQAIKCKHCHEMLSGSGGRGARRPFSPAATKRLTRSSTDSMISGVCGGFAVYADMDPVIMRLLFALVTFFSGIVPGVVAYVVMACIIPKDG